MGPSRSHLTTTPFLCLNKSGSTFEINQGVKQGKPLYPNLFNSLVFQKVSNEEPLHPLANLFNSLLEVCQKLNCEGRGVKINVVQLNNLRFADNVVLMSLSREELQEMAKELENKAFEVGLEKFLYKYKIFQYTSHSNNYFP